MFGYVKMYMLKDYSLSHDPGHDQVALDIRPRC